MAAKNTAVSTAAAAAGTYAFVAGVSMKPECTPALAKVPASGYGRYLILQILYCLLKDLVWNIC